MIAHIIRRVAMRYLPDNLAAIEIDRRKYTIRWFENGQPLHRQTGIENRIRGVWTTNRSWLPSHSPGPIGGTAIARP